LHKRLHQWAGITLLLDTIVFCHCAVNDEDICTVY